MDFRIRSWHQTTKFGVAHEQLTAPIKAKMNESKIETMLIYFFDIQDVVLKEFVLPGQTVNKQYYREFLERLRKWVHCVCPEIADTWMLHHDNVPCHTAIFVNEFLAKKLFQWFRSHHNRRIWVRVTSYFSQNSNSTSNVVILELWTTSNRSWQNNWGHFYMKISSTATGIGSNISCGV